MFGLVAILVVAMVGLVANCMIIDEFVKLAKKANPCFSKTAEMWLVGLFVPLGAAVVGVYVLTHIVCAKQGEGMPPLSANAARTAGKPMDMPEI